QGILWMAQIKFEAPGLETLVERKYLGEAEGNKLLTAYSFLLRTRNELHFQSKRAVDVLYLENQPEVALGLGYPQEDFVERVEAFMEDYYTHARLIYETTKVVESRFAEDFSRPQFSLHLRSLLTSGRNQSSETVDGFLVSEKKIDAGNPEIFKEDPHRLLRLFRHCQRFEVKPSFSLRSLVRNSLNLINSSIIQSTAANKTFRAILQNVGAVFPTLAEMHALGVLGRFTPEFGRLTCKVQHELYHRYTADAHVLATLRELDKVFSGKEKIALKYRDALRKTDVPALVYLMLFLHDLGKADGVQGHCERGVEVAEPILERMGIEKNMREQVVFMVRNHLEMVRFSMRFDLDDPEVIAAFAAKVKDTQTLRFLYVLTFCDARGTSVDLWNEYKDNLLTQLYRNTIDLLENKQPDDQGERRKNLLARITDRIPEEVTKEEIDAHFACLPERYFVHAGEEEIILHLKMAHRLLSAIIRSDAEASLVPIIEWRNDLERGFTLVHVVTWDRAGLFYHLAGAFSVTDLNILSSRAVSRSDHVTIDVFIVTGKDGGLVIDDSARRKFEETLDATLVNGANMLPLIEEQQKKNRHKKAPDVSDSLGASINPKVTVYQETSIDRTIVEIQANDHIGLLFVLARTISKLGFDITFARISTERSVAIDVFHLESSDPERTIDSQRLFDLREGLNKVVSREEFLITA
ncbi:MAG: [protein-PII] uridylyltransferase, partial [Opitutales bacterium]